MKITIQKDNLNQNIILINPKTPQYPIKHGQLTDCFRIYKDGIELARVFGENQYHFMGLSRTRKTEYLVKSISFLVKL